MPDFYEDPKQDPMNALLRYGQKVREGFPSWIKGAPTHVLAELLTALEEGGWRLVPEGVLADWQARAMAAEAACSILQADRDDYKERWEIVGRVSARMLERLREDLTRAAADARDADAASMQAAFWRSRAIELGASEDEWRREHG